MTTYPTVAALLANPERWTKGAYARDIAGKVIEYDKPEAVAFCLAGAICRVYDDKRKREGVVKALAAITGDLLIASVPTPFVFITFNDSSTHAGVLAAVTKAGI